MSLQSPPSSAPVRRPPRTHWKTWPILITAMLTTALTAALVYLLGHKSFFAETELILATVAGALFIFLAFGLYRAVHVPEEESNVDVPGWMGKEFWRDVDCSDLLNLMDLTDGWHGILIGIAMLAVLLLVFLIFLPFILVVGLALFFLFNRALRQVFRHAEECHQNLARSLGYAFLYTTLYTGWLFALLLILQHFVRH